MLPKNHSPHKFLKICLPHKVFQDGANKETQEILSQSHLPIFQEANKSSKIYEGCGFSATYSLQLEKTQDIASQFRGEKTLKYEDWGCPVYMPDMFQSITQLKIDGFSPNFHHQKALIMPRNPMWLVLRGGPRVLESRGSQSILFV